MIIVMTPIVLSIFIYYLYISGYFMNIITELYTAYKILNTYVIIPVSNTYNQLNYYVFYKNRYIVIIDDNERMLNHNEIIQYKNNLILKPYLFENKVYYKRIISKNTINGINDNVYTNNIEPSSPFLFVTFINNENTIDNTSEGEIDITDKISNFCIDKNVILDRNFMRWFMKKFKNIIIYPNSTYSINLINATMDLENIIFSSDETKAIIIDKNSYIIKTI